MLFLYTWPNPAGSFRGYRTWNCSIQEMLNIRLAYKSLFWSPSCSENSSNKAMKVQLSWFLEGESEIIIQHNSFIMQISNALTQSTPHRYKHCRFSATILTTGQCWSDSSVTFIIYMYTCIQIALNSALFSQLVDMYQKCRIKNP